MKILGRSSKVLLAAVLAMMAMTALFAASASATIVAAKFSSSGIKMTTTGVTLKRNGAEAKTCSAATLTGFAEVGSGAYTAGNGAWGETVFYCPSPSSFEMFVAGNAKYDDVAKRYYLTINDYSAHSLFSSFYGSWWQSAGSKANGTWVNGSGATPSTVTFSEQVIGFDESGKKISISGSFKVTTSTGGLVTLSH